MIGGWRLGNSSDGVQADFFRVPYAQANLAKIPDDLTDEQLESALGALAACLPS